MVDIKIVMVKESDKKYLVIQQIPEDCKEELGGLPLFGTFVNNDGWSFVPSGGKGFPFQLYESIYKSFKILVSQGYPPHEEVFK